MAQIRGYTDVRYDVVSPSPNYVVATCSITWKPNYETEGQEVTFSSIGDASHENTKSFAKLYLGPIAENRAFVRCVRNFLKINIVSSEELGDAKFVPETSTENKSDPYNVLENVMKDKGVTFEQIKGKLVKEKYEDAEELKSVNDLPKFKLFELVERLKKVKKKA